MTSYSAFIGWISILFFKASLTQLEICSLISDWFLDGFESLHKPIPVKGNCAFADFRYGKEDSISPKTLICAATKS